MAHDEIEGLRSRHGYRRSQRTNKLGKLLYFCRTSACLVQRGLVAQQIENSASSLSGELRELFHGRVADAARRRVDDPHQGDFIGGIDQHAQVSEDVLDFLAVVKLDTAGDLILQPAAKE